MNCWICVTNTENWAIVKKSRVWGIPQRYRLIMQRVEVGDPLLFHVRLSGIVGASKIASKPFDSNEKLFRWELFGKYEVFPHRVKLEHIVLAKQPIRLKEFVPMLKFIRNKEFWGPHLRRPMNPILKEDYELISGVISRQ